MVCALVCILILTVILLAVKLIVMKLSLREIKQAFEERLESETNTLIDVSSADKDVCALAASINEQLRLLRSERLRFQRGDAELKTAVTNISHDLRTPLTAISGYLDLMDNTELSDEQRKYSEIIRGRAKLMNQLTEELFDYSVIVSPNLVSQNDERSNISQIVLSNALEESIMSFYGALKKRGIEPVVDIAECEKTVCADPALISRVFSNIISNAIKYSDGDLEIKMDINGVITFSNHAHALSPADTARLFDRFYTVENARNSTGLGLSIARAIVLKLGGSISAQCEDQILTIRLNF